ncbi:MAG: RIP metalloprotease RseP [Bacteroidia bacterium]
MQTFIMVAQLIAALSILVTVHELGHFLAARLFKIRVDKFYLFFDFLFPLPNVLKFSLFKIKKGDTEYGLGWFPFGGYVQIAGMVDENMNTEQLNQPPQPWEFRSKPAWQRMIVMLGGIIFNVLLGIFIFAMISYTYGEKFLINSSVKHGIAPSALAEEMGFHKGDRLISVNGKPIIHFEDALTGKLIMEDKVVYIVNRNGADTGIILPHDFLKKLTRGKRALFFLPRTQVFAKRVTFNSNADKAGLKSEDQIIAINGNYFNCYDEFQPLLRSNANKSASLVVLRRADTVRLKVNVAKDSTIGFQTYDKTFQYDSLQYSFFASIPNGMVKAYENIEMQFKGWGKIFHGDIPVNKAVQGPVGLAQFFGTTWDWQNFWWITALFSLGLAFANVLPIPALDGGHVVVLLIEMLIGRPLSIKIQERIQTIGMVILLSLFVLIFSNDIWNLISR